MLFRLALFLAPYKVAYFNPLLATKKATLEIQSGLLIVACFFNVVIGEGKKSSLGLLTSHVRYFASAANDAASRPRSGWRRNTTACKREYAAPFTWRL